MFDYHELRIDYVFYMLHYADLTCAVTRVILYGSVYSADAIVRHLYSCGYRDLFYECVDFNGYDLYNNRHAVANNVVEVFIVDVD